MNGIGPVVSRRLASRNIDNLAQLASMEPRELSEAIDVSEVRAMGFIDEARKLLEKPQG